MKSLSIRDELTSLPYHGRGIILGRSADGKKAVIAYFIMGRSVNSRNRELDSLRHSESAEMDREFSLAR